MTLKIVNNVISVHVKGVLGQPEEHLGKRQCTDASQTSVQSASTFSSFYSLLLSENFSLLFLECLGNSRHTL